MFVYQRTVVAVERMQRSRIRGPPQATGASFHLLRPSETAKRPIAQFLSTCQMVPPRTREPYCSHAIKRNVQILAEQMNYLQTSLAMFAEELQQVLALDEGNLRIVHYFGCQFVRFARHGCAQAKYFAGSRHPEHQPLPRFGANRQLRATFAQDKNAARGASLMEQRFTSGDLADRFDAVECDEGIGGKIAKNAVRAQFAIETARLVGCALHVRSYRSPLSKETVTTVTNYRDGLLLREATAHNLHTSGPVFNNLRRTGNRL